MQKYKQWKWSNFGGVQCTIGLLPSCDTLGCRIKSFSFQQGEKTGTHHFLSSLEKFLIILDNSILTDSFQQFSFLHMLYEEYVKNINCWDCNIQTVATYALNYQIPIYFEISLSKLYLAISRLLLGGGSTVWRVNKSACNQRESITGYVRLSVAAPLREVSK